MTQVVSPEIRERTDSRLDLDPTDSLYGDHFQAEVYKGPWGGKMGIVQLEEGCNFSTLTGPDRTRVDLCLQDPDDPSVSTMRWELHELETRPDGRKAWGGYVKGFGPDLVYAVRNATVGNPGLYDTPVLDPFAKSIITAQDPEHPEITIPYAVVPPRVEDLPSVVEAPRVNEPERVIYEANIRGLSMQHLDVPEELRGTYLGACHPAVIKHLKDLGITSIELLPFQQFITQKDLAKKGLTNYTGYNTAGFFAPHTGFASSPDVNAALVESQIMINTFNEAGIEVIMDVVYNHTSEGDPLDKDRKDNPREPDPAHSFRLLDDEGYYYRVGPNGDRNISGCGNTLDTSNPVVRDMILESLRFWKRKGVAGFRFDLLTGLTRNRKGELDIENDPLMAEIDEDPELKDLVLIGEPWDADKCPPEGQVGKRKNWREWSRSARDISRDFWNPDTPHTHKIGQLAKVLAEDFASKNGSINFVTAHDGFPMRDVVSYNVKHNDDNGEGGADGSDDNKSSNHGGGEGPSDNPEIEARRERTIRNFIATFMMMRGTPMMLAGDEMGNTQKGNNNAYCQDNPISWLNWEEKRSLLNFWKEMVAVHQRSSLGDSSATMGALDASSTGENGLDWFSPTGNRMRQDEWDSGIQVVGSYSSGAANPERDAESYLFYVNGNQEGTPNADVTVTLPRESGAKGVYELVADTLTGEADRNGIRIMPETFTLNAMTAVVLRRRRTNEKPSLPQDGELATAA